MKGVIGMTPVTAADLEQNIKELELINNPDQHILGMIVRYKNQLQELKEKEAANNNQ